MQEFRFAEINWLHATWGILACCAILLVLELRGRSLLDRMLSPLMQESLVRKTSLVRRVSGIALFGLALVALMFALMRPQWGKTVQSMKRIESQIMVCLDVSKSMLAEDVVPNRLERAKVEIDSLLSLLDEGQQVGLTAFAGKATVLCPMTTDHGFLRLILRESGPSSAGLGGTRIGEAVSKATAGFREVGDVNRLILLITDGEDHDSFPLDAAKLAKEKGIRIVSIGFGDEAGSKIEYTDPNTGVRSFLRDREGREVISRLDGETLRDIALETEGAYIPAGTGALDWQSIYDDHIRTLLAGTTSQEERVIRNEAYQWCVLAALVLLLLSLLVAAPLTTRPIQPLTGIRQASRSSAAVLLLGALIFGGYCAPCFAQQRGATPIKPNSQVPNSQVADSQVADSSQVNGEDPQVVSEKDARPAEAGETSDELERDVPPREVYNRAIRFISSDPDRAERMLSEVRFEAGVDGELRYRALYNLGWVEIARADSLLESEPEQALKHLQLAASHFREAIRVRPESRDARHNLEVISRRILALTDALAKQDPLQLQERLDELIERLRDHQIELQAESARIAGSSLDIDERRSDFRRLGVNQRTLISDLQKFAADANQELAALRQAKDDAQDSEGQLRAAQLTAMLNYIETASQRLTKARSFTRRLQVDRALLRWSTGLIEAKRARDQLRNPVEVLSVLVEDGTELATQTQVLARSRELQLGDQSNATVPTWLTNEFLSESQTAMTSRVQELTLILDAAASQTETAPSDPGLPQPSPADSQQADRAQQEMLQESIALALPHLKEAERFFAEAGTRLDATETAVAFIRQSEALAQLMTAAEYFFDHRRLIEVMYRDESMLESLLPQLQESPESWLGSAIELQNKNLDRATRLRKLLDLQMQGLPSDGELGGTDPQSTAATPGNGVSGNADAEQIRQQLEQFKLAGEILASAEREMNSVSTGLSEAVRISDEVGKAMPAPRPPSPRTTFQPQKADIQLPDESLRQAVVDLEELRRLFFTLVEHLRETAQRQSALNDNVVGTVANDSQQTVEAFGPLQARQQTLQQIAAEISKALDEQGKQMSESTPAASGGNSPLASGQSASGQAGAGPSVEQDAEQRRAAGEVLQRASQLVAQGSDAMLAADQEFEVLVDQLSRLSGDPQSPATQSPGPESDRPTEVAETEGDGSENENPPETTAAEPASDESGKESSVSPDERGESRVPVALLENQRIALQKLVEALALLDDQQNGQDQNQDQQDRQESEQQQNQQQPQDQQVQQNMNAEQMLQAIREREAQRRKDKNQAAGANTAVDKDW